MTNTSPFRQDPTVHLALPRIEVGVLERLTQMRSGALMDVRIDTRLLRLFADQRSLREPLRQGARVTVQYFARSGGDRGVLIAASHHVAPDAQRFLCRLDGTQSGLLDAGAMSAGSVPPPQHSNSQPWLPLVQKEDKQ